MRNTPMHYTPAEMNELWDGGPPLPTELETYVDSNGDRCYRPKGEGERVRLANLRERRLRLEVTRRAVIALRLDEIDPDWPSRFLSTDQAARFYWQELAEYDSTLDAPAKRSLGVLR